MNLPCLNCQKEFCAVEPKDPPCQYIDPFQIANAVNKRLYGMAHNTISAVIPIYQPTTARLNDCLKAVLPQVDEVIVCRDQAGAFPKEAMQHPKIRYITSRLHDSGFGRKMNHAFRHTSGGMVLSLNDDVILDPDAVSKMMDVMKRDEKCAVVGMLLWYAGRTTIQHAGCRRNNGDIGWGHALHRQSICTIKEPHEVECVTGASVLLRREAFYAVGGMDERFHLYFEDNDLALSLRKAGWQIWFTPHAAGIHDEHSSTRNTPGVVDEVQRSREIFREKWSEYFSHNANNPLGNFDYL